jgi:hypothetical protein
LIESLDQVRLGMLDLTGPLLRLFSLERWLRSLRNVRAEKILNDGRLSLGPACLLC